MSHLPLRPDEPIHPTRADLANTAGRWIERIREAEALLKASEATLREEAIERVQPSRDELLAYARVIAEQEGVFELLDLPDVTQFVHLSVAVDREVKKRRRAPEPMGKRLLQWFTTYERPEDVQEDTKRYKALLASRIRDSKQFINHHGWCPARVLLLGSDGGVYAWDTVTYHPQNFEIGRVEGSETTGVFRPLADPSTSAYIELPEGVDALRPLRPEDAVRPDPDHPEDVAALALEHLDRILQKSVQKKRASVEAEARRLRKVGEEIEGQGWRV